MTWLSVLLFEGSVGWWSVFVAFAAEGVVRVDGRFGDFGNGLGSTGDFGSTGSGGRAGIFGRSGRFWGFLLRSLFLGLFLRLLFRLLLGLLLLRFFLELLCRLFLPVRLYLRLLLSGDGGSFNGSAYISEAEGYSSGGRTDSWVSRTVSSPMKRK